MVDRSGRTNERKSKGKGKKGGLKEVDTKIRTPPPFYSISPSHVLPHPKPVSSSVTPIRSPS